MCDLVAHIVNAYHVTSSEYAAVFAQEKATPDILRLRGKFSAQQPIDQEKPHIVAILKTCTAARSSLQFVTRTADGVQTNGIHGSTGISDGSLESV
jgi:hypothetical protein